MNRPITVLVVKGEGEPREPAGLGSGGLEGAWVPWADSGEAVRVGKALDGGRGVPVVITENFLGMGLLRVTGHFFSSPFQMLPSHPKSRYKGNGIRKRKSWDPFFLCKNPKIFRQPLLTCSQG